MASKSVGWRDKGEWMQVYAWLFSDSVQDMERGCDRITAWTSRGPLPLGVECTAQLVRVVALDRGDADFSGKSEVLRLSYAMALVRFINGFSDKEQRGTVAASVASHAARLNIPEMLVDLRHDATHLVLPSVQMLRLSVPHALKWLKENYWERQKAYLEDQATQIQQLLETVKAQRVAHVAAIAAEEQQRQQQLEESGKKKKKKSKGTKRPDPEASATIASIIELASPNAVRDPLLSTMLLPGMMLPGDTKAAKKKLTKKEKKAAKSAQADAMEGVEGGKDGATDMSSSEDSHDLSVLIWEDAIQEFSAEWSHFAFTLCLDIFHLLAHERKPESPRVVRLMTWLGHALALPELSNAQRLQLTQFCIVSESPVVHRALRDVLLPLSEEGAAAHAGSASGSDAAAPKEVEVSPIAAFAAIMADFPIPRGNSVHSDGECDTGSAVLSQELLDFEAAVDELIAGASTTGDNRPTKKARGANNSSKGTGKLASSAPKDCSNSGGGPQMMSGVASTEAADASQRWQLVTDPRWLTCPIGSLPNCAFPKLGLRPSSGAAGRTKPSGKKSGEETATRAVGEEEVSLALGVAESPLILSADEEGQIITENQSDREADPSSNWQTASDRFSANPLKRKLLETDLATLQSGIKLIA